MKKYKLLVDLTNFPGEPIKKKGDVFIEKEKDHWYSQNTYEEEECLTGNILGLGKKHVENNPKVFEEIK